MTAYRWHVMGLGHELSCVGGQGAISNRARGRHGCIAGKGVGLCMFVDILL